MKSTQLVFGVLIFGVNATGVAVGYLDGWGDPLDWANLLFAAMGAAMIVLAFRREAR